MTQNQMKTTNQKRLSQLGWLSISACALCCTLPVVGMVAGIGAFSVLGVYLEQIAFLFLSLAGVLFVWHFFKKKRAKTDCSSSCEMGCRCKTDQGTF